MGQQNQVGFIGLGRMGQPMATNVIRAGFSMGVWNRTAEKVKPLVDLGAKSYASAAAVARESDVVITMLSAPKDVEAVVLGPDGVVDGIQQGSVLIDMSTVDPATSLALAAQIAAKQAEFLDAPVAGSVGPATQGTLAIMVGGLPGTLQRVRPILQCMGQAIIHAGEIGMGSTFKLATNLILGHLTAGFAEALLLLERSGAKTEGFFDLLANTAFRSPWFESKGRQMAVRNFQTQFAWEHMQKDLKLMAKHAREVGAPVPVTECIHELYASGADRHPQYSAEDFSALIALLEESIVKKGSQQGFVDSA